MSVPEEPSAASRTMARIFRDWFVALRHEGFSEAQALQVVSHAFSTLITRGMDNVGDEE